MPKRKSAPTKTMTTAVRSKKAKLQSVEHYSGSSNSGPSPVQQNLKKLFDKYRDDPTNEPDRIGLEGTMGYFEALGIGLDDVIFLAMFDLLDAPEMGVLTRESFVNNWSNVSTPSNPCDNEKSQKLYIETLRQKLKSDPAYFRQVYKGSFTYAKPAGQRVVPLEDSFAFWDMFFGGGKGGIQWNSPTTKWYDLWREYYEGKNKRPVNKDLWNQVAELVAKTREEGGETLGWWSEDGAWPTAVDEFVAFVKEKREKGGAMDTT
ncbi:Scaffold-type E3 ligase [Lithohypha guttulata]|uniref:Defective in cullin neddylation protein n=1 Tax=Lithohypha guttulata TaxID=1690604 RepID=A0AAN7Y6U5_9EURO|nr:Scaffold-type E3 ligase [Lithohypha guttulata]